MGLVPPKKDARGSDGVSSSPPLPHPTLQLLVDCGPLPDAMTHSLSSSSRPHSCKHSGARSGHNVGPEGAGVMRGPRSQHPQHWRGGRGGERPWSPGPEGSWWWRRWQRYRRYLTQVQDPPRGLSWQGDLPAFLPSDSLGCSTPGSHLSTPQPSPGFQAEGPGAWESAFPNRVQRGNGEPQGGFYGEGDPKPLTIPRSEQRLLKAGTLGTQPQAHLPPLQPTSCPRPVPHTLGTSQTRASRWLMPACPTSDSTPSWAQGHPSAILLQPQSPRPSRG